MAYTYDIILDGAAGRFVIDGDRLEVAGTLVPSGVYSVTLRATQPDGWTAKPFEIEVLADPKRKRFSKSSAGVYSGDVLIRTLWSEQPFEGLIDGRLWDGLDDDGKIAASGNYTIKVLDASSVKTEWLGVVGNTSAPESPGWHPMDTIQGMAITAGGKIYVATGYNEAFTGSIKTTVANPQLWDYVLPVPFRSSAAVPFSVVTDDELAYFSAGCASIAGEPLNGVSFIFAVTVADDSAHTFSSGSNVAPSGRVYSGASVVKNTTIVAGNIFGEGFITGLAVQRAGNMLFATRGLLDEIYVLHKKTGAAITTVTGIAKPAAITVDHNDNVWLAYKSSENHFVSKFTVDSETGAFSLVAGSTIVGLSAPLALSVTPDGAILRIADGGTSQQIKSYSNRIPFALQSTYGQATGYALGPAVANDKLGFYNSNWMTFGTIGPGSGGRAMTFLCHQPDGKLWVGDPTNMRSLRFTISGSVYAYIDQLAWGGASYSQAMDAANPTRVFMEWREYAVNYSKARGDPDFWTLVANYGWNIPANYNDKYSRARRAITLANGRTYCHPRSYSAGTELVEITSTGLRFTGLVDANFTTAGLATNGNINRTIVAASTGKPIVYSRRTLTGFDAYHNPQYTPFTQFLTSADTAANDPKDVRGGPSFGFGWALTSGGVIPAYDPRKVHTGYHLAGIDGETGVFRWRALPSTPSNRWKWTDSVTKARTTDDDWPRGYFDVSAVASAGNNCLVMGTSIFAGYHGEGWGNAQANKWWHYHESGLLIENFGVVGLGTGEGQPGMAGNAFSSSVAALGDDVILSHNDESAHSGVHLWRMKGCDGIAIYDADVTWQASDYSPPIWDPNDLLASLPYNSTLVDGVGGWTRSPATDIITSPTSAQSSPFLSVITNHYQYDHRWGMPLRPITATPPDINIRATFATMQLISVSREISVILGAPWRLSARVQLMQGDIGAIDSPAGYTRIELLDASDRIIARFGVNETHRSFRWNILGNNKLIQNMGSNESLWDLVRRHRSLMIEATAAGEIVFSYAALPKFVCAPFDDAATWAVPTKLRISLYFSPGGAFSRAINFSELRID